MALREKYSHAIQIAKQLRMDGAAEERDGKLHFNGTVNSTEEKNQIYNALKTVPDWQKEVVGEIKVRERSPAGVSHTTYTVKAGDTLSEIAQKHLGSAKAYMDIYNLNRDQLSDPDKIKPGQVLKIPQPTHK